MEPMDDSICPDPAPGRDRQGFTAEQRRMPAAFCCRKAIARRLAGAGLAAALLLVVSAAVAGAATAGDDDLHGRMLALVNAARAEAGLAPLVLERRLSAAACAQARDLAAGGPLTHRSRDGSNLADRLTRAGYRFAMAAENLAAGAPTPDETVWLWLSSPGHRRNMLTAGFNQAGAAYVSGDGMAIWVLVLAKPRTGSPAPMDDSPSGMREDGQPFESRSGSSPLPSRSSDSNDQTGDKRLTCY
jgi:uncharacterized protein YkwD